MPERKIDEREPDLKTIAEERYIAREGEKDAAKALGISVERLRDREWFKRMEQDDSWMIGQEELLAQGIY